MKRLQSFLLIVIFLSSIPVFSQVKHIIVIGVDGMGSYGVEASVTPVMDSLMRNGSYSLDARAVYPTISAPNWASMVKGVTPLQHRIGRNNYKKRSANEKSPTIFKVIEQKDSSASMLVINEWVSFTDFIEQDVDVTKVHTRDNRETLERLEQYFPKQMPLLTFIHLVNVDNAGHSFGAESEAYKRSIAQADSTIGAAIKIIQSNVPEGEVIFLITSDHGFRGRTHGSITRKEKRIPLIVTGYGIRRNEKIRRKVNTYETASTIAYLLNIEAPKEWKGKPVKEISIFPVRTLPGKHKGLAQKGW